MKLTHAFPAFNTGDASQAPYSVAATDFILNLQALNQDTTDGPTAVRVQILIGASFSGAPNSTTYAAVTNGSIYINANDGKIYIKKGSLGAADGTWAAEAA